MRSLSICCLFALAGCIHVDVDMDEVQIGHAQDGEEARAVVAAVDDLFDGMREKDEALMRRAMDESVTFIVVGDDGPGGATSESPDGFIARVMSAEAVYDERMWSPEVRINGDLATLWAPYSFHLDDAFSHCGFDAFQLVKRENRWRIVSIAYTRRTDDCDGLVSPE